MKHLLHSLATFLLLSLGMNQGYAQCVSDTLLYEDFQSQVIPVTWTNLDLDSNTTANNAPPNWFIQVDAQSTTPGDTNYVAAASSWFTPGGVANNWLILDSINVCSSNIDLAWKSAPFEGPAFVDGYKVLISTTTNTPAAFTDTIFIAAEDTSGTGNLGFGNVHTNFNRQRGVLQNWRVSLGAYNGQTIYIAFVHDSDDDSSLNLDDIFVGVLPSHDLELKTLTGSIYSMIPVTQVATINYSGTIQNNYGMGTNPKFQVRVRNTGILVFADSTIMTGMLPEGSDTLLTISNGHTPMAVVGTYNVVGWVTSDSVDVIPNNDSMTYSYTVTDSVYAREKGPNVGDLSIGNTNSGFIGQEFDIVQTDDLTSVSYYRTGGGGNDSIRVVLYDMLNGFPNSVVTTGSWIVDTATAAGWRTYEFGTNYVTLPAATYIIGLEESKTTAVRVGTNPNYYIPGSTWALLNRRWANLESFNFLVVCQIRPNFGAPRVINVEQIEEPATIKLFPQPAKDWLTIDLEQPAEHVTIYTMSGTIVRSLHNLTNNQVPVQDLTPGVYLLEVEQDGQRFHARFNKQ